MPCRELLCRSSATYMPAGLVLLPQTPLMFKHAYWLNNVAIWMLAGPLSLNQHAWRPSATQYCHSYCAYSVSLSAVHAGVVSYYRPCILVWCLTISRGASLKVMSFGVVPHYQLCMLVWCLTIGHAFWCDASL